MAGEWRPDPSGQYEVRWWDGQQWTDQVGSGGQVFTAPPVVPHAPLQPAQPTGHPPQVQPTAQPMSLADSFAAADRYGQPLAPVLERLADEARQHRRRQADTLARQLPVRMSLPLVLCTLPSFVLLAVVPLLLAALSSLHR